MSGVRFRGTLPVPGLSSFPELNVRTYVTDGEKPGIWFFSPLARPGRQPAWRSRRRAFFWQPLIYFFFRLPYFRANQ